MTVIDLINKYNNNEDMPNIIKFNSNVYHKVGADYYCTETSTWLIENDMKNFVSFDMSIEILKDEVDDYDCISRISDIGILEKRGSKVIDDNFEILRNKINEVIEYVNNLDTKEDNNG